MKFRLRVGLPILALISASVASAFDAQPDLRLTVKRVQSPDSIGKAIAASAPTLSPASIAAAISADALVELDPPGYWDVYFEDYSWDSSYPWPTNDYNRWFLSPNGSNPSMNQASFVVGVKSGSGQGENGSSSDSRTAKATIGIRIVWRDHTPGQNRPLPTAVTIMVTARKKRRCDAWFGPETYTNGTGSAYTTVTIGNGVALASGVSGPLMADGMMDFKSDNAWMFMNEYDIQKGAGTEFTFNVLSDVLNVTTEANMAGKTYGGCEVSAIGQAEQSLLIWINQFVFDGQTYIVYGQEPGD